MATAAAPALVGPPNAPRQGWERGREELQMSLVEEFDERRRMAAAV
jgi:hypothetical protein